MRQSGAASSDQYDRSGQPIVIGLVNNASARAQKSTELHFRNFVAGGCCGARVEFRFFVLPDMFAAIEPHSQHQKYLDVRELRRQSLDGLIVTGMEPQGKALRDEPSYANLAELADWTQAHGVPTIWSCLAAHVAALHLDGIARVRLPEKLSGLFECTASHEHNGLLRGLPAHWLAPHSRYHGLPEADLDSCGYQVLSRSDIAGADIILRPGNAPALLLQGHPEYCADTIGREYIRDLKRYLDGERGEYPKTPVSIVGPKTEAILAGLREDAIAHGIRPDLALVSMLLEKAKPNRPWEPVATRLMANWLSLVRREAGSVAEDVRQVSVALSPAGGECRP